MTTFVRGATVDFTVQCTDEAGLAMTPDSADLNLAFISAVGVRTKTTVAMTIDGSTVSADWDSSVAAPGVVKWNVKAVGSKTIEQDGSIVLTANEANL